MKFLDRFSINSIVKFLENMSIGIGVVPRGRKDRRTEGRKTDMMKPIFTFFITSIEPA